MATIKRRETAGGKVRWDAQVYVGRVAGKASFVHKTFTRQTDAAKWVRAQETLKDNGELTQRPSKETLAAYLERWLGIYAGDARAVTVYNYRATLRRWVMDPKNGAPPLGRVRLDRLSTKGFNNLYVYMREHGIQPRGIQYLHGILRKALNDAVDEGEMPKNPVRKARVPTKALSQDQDRAVRAMSREQATRFLAAAAEDRYSALWHVLLFGGLRPSEAFGLKWDDVDFESSEVHVRHTLSRTGLDKEKHPKGWVLAPTKTDKSKRAVALPALAMRALEAWRTQQKRDRLAVGSEWQEHGFVFTTAFGAPLEGCNLNRGPFRRVMREAGLGTFGPQPKKPRSGPTAERPFKSSFRMYDLRHTCATLLLEDGEDLLIVSQRLGHSSIKLTADTYAGFMPTRQQEAASRFDRMYGTG